MLPTMRPSPQLKPVRKGVASLGVGLAALLCGAVTLLCAAVTYSSKEKNLRIPDNYSSSFKKDAP
jgi:hypothetical protein